MKNLFRSLRPIADIFRPPFDGLWLIAVLYFFWAFLVYPHSSILRGEFPDTDDYMYLNQLLDWLGGQGWYDNVQHRLDPPNGAPIHFSRLAMLPMAAIVKLIEALGLGPKGSATVMAMIYPPMLFGLLLITVKWVAQIFMRKDWAGVTAFTGLFATQTLYLFDPGHVDHHNLIIVLDAASLGCALRMLQKPDMRRWPVIAGAIMALGLVVALEILPWLFVLSAFLGISAAFKGGNAARGGMLYALVLFVGSVIGLLLTRPPADLYNLDVLTYSIVYVILAAGIAVAFAGVFLASKAPLAVRMIVGAVLAVGTGFAFLHRFPELMTGPYGGLDPGVARIILDDIVEAQPLKFENNNWFSVIWITASVTIGAVAGLRFLVKSSSLQRWLWSLYMLMFVAMIGLTFFYQRRYAGTMNMMGIVPLSVLLQRGWSWIGEHWRGRRQVFAEIGLLLLVGPLPAVLMPALVDNRSFNLGVLLFPVVQDPAGTACEMYGLENILRDPTGLGSKPRTIMNTLGIGPELLFRTQHKVLAAPYHMDVEGNVDSARFFSTPYPEEAEAIARRRNIDLVVACIYSESFYLEPSATDKSEADAAPGKDFAPHFIERLSQRHIPSWLKPVRVPGLYNYVIYEVLPPQPQKPAK